MTQTPAPPRRDPALSLLDRIGAEALNPQYRLSHERRAAAGRGHAAGRRRGPHGPVLTAVVVALAGVLVGVLVVASRAQSGAVASERDRLVALAGQQRDQVEQLATQVSSLDAEVARLSDESLQTRAAGSARAQQLATLGIAAGVTPVVGPGARVVVRDAPPGEAQGGAQGGAEAGQVLDIDLQQVVNGLWQAGAEAVAVNGQRVGALTAIRSAEDVVLVNYVPLVAPYEVLAIGDPRTLPTDFLRSDGGAWLQAVQLSAGITFTIDAVTDDQSLPGATVGSPRYATPIPPEGTTQGGDR